MLDWNWIIGNFSWRTDGSPRWQSGRLSSALKWGKPGKRFKNRAIFVHLERFPTDFWEYRFVIGHFGNFSWCTARSAPPITVHEDSQVGAAIELDIKMTETEQNVQISSDFCTPWEISDQFLGISYYDWIFRQLSANAPNSRTIEPKLQFRGFFWAS